MTSTPQTHVPLAAAIARGFRFDPDAPIEPAAEQTPMEAISEPSLGDADITPEMLDAMIDDDKAADAAAASAQNDSGSAAGDAETPVAPAGDAENAGAQDDSDPADSATGEADGAETADDADAETPAPAADKAAPAEPKTPAKQTVQAPEPDPEAERLEADFRAVKEERRALLAKIAADEEHDPYGEDATKLNRVNARFELLKDQREERREHVTQAQLQHAEQERGFVAWSEGVAKENAGRDAAGWREVWNKCGGEMSTKYPKASPETLQALTQERFEYQVKLLNGRAASEALKAKAAAAKPAQVKKPVTPVTPNGARTAPRAAAPSNPAPAAKTARESLFRGDRDQSILQELRSFDLL